MEFQAVNFLNKTIINSDLFIENAKHEIYRDLSALPLTVNFIKMTQV